MQNSKSKPKLSKSRPNSTGNQSKKSPAYTILDCFARQKVKKQDKQAEIIVECPVCNVMVCQSKINRHLDNECTLDTGIETPKKTILKASQWKTEKNCEGSKINEAVGISPYFSDENSNSVPKIPVRRKLSLSFGRKKLNSVGQKCIALSQNENAIEADSEEFLKNLQDQPEEIIYVKPDVDLLSKTAGPRIISRHKRSWQNSEAETSKRLKCNVPISADQCSSNKKVSSKSYNDISHMPKTSPKSSNSKITKRILTNTAVSSLKESSSTFSHSKSTPEKCGRTSDLSPPRSLSLSADSSSSSCTQSPSASIRRVEGSTFGDISVFKTPEKRSENPKVRKPHSSSKNGESPQQSLLFSPLSQSQQQSPRKRRFLEKIPACFSDLKIEMSPVKIGTPSKFFSPFKQPGLHSPCDPDQFFSYSPSPSKSTISSQENDTETLFYYLSNFLDILKSVLDMPDDLALFNEDDLKIVKQFYNLPDKCQELYVRLFTRKHKWFLEGKIKYPEIAEDLKPVLEELTDSNLLENDDNLNDLKTILHILPAAATKALCGHINLKVTTQKVDMVKRILEHCSKQHGMFKSFGATKNATDIALKKAKLLLGRCYRLKDEPRRIFVRILMLYSLTDTVEDGKLEDSPAQMTTMLLINMGRMVFPPFRVWRSLQIFRSRDDLIRYEKAVLLEGSILAAMESKDFKRALTLANEAGDSYSSLIHQEDLVSHDTSLPTFLRVFTAGQVLTRCLNQRVEIFQKLRNYEEAIIQLNDLLEQDVYCQHYRGHWVERLALNLDMHLHEPEKAFLIIAKELKNPKITISHKLALYQRAQRLAESKKHKQVLKNSMEDIAVIEVTKVPEVYIEGRAISSNIPGHKSVFLSNEISSSGDNTDVNVCSVEELALSHYREHDYPNGVHAEGSSLVSLFGLLFWDIIYCPGIPDAFRSSHQFYPLDLNCTDFYKNRKKAIDSRIKLLKHSTSEIIADRIRQCWRSHEGQTSLVNWSIYHSFENAQSLAGCIGGKCIAEICERFAKNFRHHRSGVPDLTIWNPKTKQWKMVEVKGPGDRLSHKQIIWLDYLHGIGVNVEVCYVKGTIVPSHIQSVMPLLARKKSKNLLPFNREGIFEIQFYDFNCIIIQDSFKRAMSVAVPPQRLVSGTKNFTGYDELKFVSH